MDIKTLGAEETLALVKEAAQAHHGSGQPILPDGQFRIDFPLDFARGKSLP
jgi:hypothetical protein